MIGTKASSSRMHCGTPQRAGRSLESQCQTTYTADVPSTDATIIGPVALPLVQLKGMPEPTFDLFPNIFKPWMLYIVGTL